jgi:HD-like signal output (HDOD) protein
MGFLESIAETQELVSLPTVATKVLSMLKSDDVDIREISKHVESDASMSMKILRLANSPMFALSNQVTSINQAIMTVGLNRVTNIVLGVSIFSKFVYLSRSAAAQFVDKFWTHSAATAAVSKAISTKMKRSFQDAEFLCGLIHDIGKLSMLQYDSTMFTEVLRLISEEGMSDVEAEAKLYGATHSQAGEVITRMWKLPDNLQAAVSYHENPSIAGDHVGLTSVVRLADILCEQWGAGIGEQVQNIVITEDTSWKNLCSLYPNMKEVNAETFCNELKDEYSKASSFISAMISD